MNFLCYIQRGWEAGGGRRPCPGCLQVELMIDYGSPLKESPSHSSPTVSPRPNLQTAQEQSKPTILSRIHRASRARRSGGGGASRARRAEHGARRRRATRGRRQARARRVPGAHAARRAAGGPWPAARRERQVAGGRRRGARPGAVRREQQVASGQARLRAAPVPGRTLQSRPTPSRGQAPSGQPIRIR